MSKKKRSIYQQNVSGKTVRFQAGPRSTAQASAPLHALLSAAGAAGCGQTRRAERPLLAGGRAVAMATVRAGWPGGGPGLSRAGRPRQRQSCAGLPAGETERRGAGRGAGPARAGRGLAVLARLPVCGCVCTCVCCA